MRICRLVLFEITGLEPPFTPLFEAHRHPGFTVKSIVQEKEEEQTSGITCKGALFWVVLRFSSLSQTDQTAQNPRNRMALGTTKFLPPSPSLVGENSGGGGEKKERKNKDAKKNDLAAEKGLHPSGLGWGSRPKAPAAGAYWAPRSLGSIARSHQLGGVKWELGFGVLRAWGKFDFSRGTLSQKRVTSREARTRVSVFIWTSILVGEPSPKNG